MGLIGLIKDGVCGVDDLHAVCTKTYCLEAFQDFAAGQYFP